MENMYKIYIFVNVHIGFLKKAYKLKKNLHLFAKLVTIKHRHVEFKFYMF